MSRPPRARLLALVLLFAPAVALAGCAAPAADASAELAPPRLGDAAEYAVSGNFIAFARWANGGAFSSTAPRLALGVDAAEGAVDGFGAYHPAYRVVTRVNDGAAFTERRSVLVNPEHGAVVQAHAPIGSEGAAVAFDERGYPWAWGASLFHGAPLEKGRTVPFTLPANAGQDAPRALAFVVEGRERLDDGRDAWRVNLTRAPGVTWTLWLDPAVPYPVRVAIAFEDPDALGTFVRLQGASADAPVRFEARLASVTRGDTPVPPRDSQREWLDEPVAAEFAPWDREVPPEGAPSVPFRLTDALQWVKTFDPGFSQWYADNPGSILYRATYHARPGPAEGTSVHAWLIGYVSRSDAYYEVVVERTVPSAQSSIPGLTQVTESGPVAAPGGVHGWFPTESLPDRLLTLASGIALLQAYYPTPGVEIFLRSFTDPVGYSYFLDGGFHAEGGRYTVIVNAQSGFVQAAVGPVEPLTAPLAPAGL